MSDNKPKGKIYRRLRDLFITGVIVTAPLFLTLIVFFYVFSLLDSFLGRIIQPFVNLPGGKRIPGIGFLALMVIIFLAGAFTRWYLGRKALEFTEMFFSKIPVLRVIYHGTKQVGDFLLSKKKAVFKHIVLIPWFSDKVYMLGFIHESSIAEIQDEELVSVYVPTTPNPTTGFVVFVKKRDLRFVEMPPEDAIKLILSLGMIKSQLVLSDSPPQAKAEEFHKEGG